MELGDICNILEILGKYDSDNYGITFVAGEKEELYLSYHDLYLRALSVLYALQEKGMQKGDEILFQVEDNESFVTFFWASIMGGIVPVPVTVGHNNEHRLKVLKIWKLLNNPRLLTTSKALSNIEKLLCSSEDVSIVNEIIERALVLEEIHIDAGKKGKICSAGMEDTAYIQFSSGSTGEPKGVILTHGNIIYNVEAMGRSIAVNSNDVFLSWMPLTHDMGMIGFHIAPVLQGMNQYIMPTGVFIRKPAIWIQKLNEHRVTITCSPNFGYRYFLNSIKNSNDFEWDLSCVRIIFNGAEPISHELCNEFLDKMQKWGLERTAMYCVYGLAEASLGVAFPHLQKGLVTHYLNRERLKTGEVVEELEKDEPGAISFVEEGYPVSHCKIRIVDENNNELEENFIGNIQISGKNVTKGYYNNPIATANTITADGWLNTGDLGFIKDGRLVVTGRSKDIIFVNGHNVYPHDIERVAEEINGIELGEVAVCGVYNNESSKEEIIVFAQFKKSPEEFLQISMDIKNHLGERGGWSVYDVIPLKKIPKTTSGKIQRYKLIKAYESGEYQGISNKLKELARQKSSAKAVNPRTLYEEALVRICADILRAETVGINDSFFEMGASSLQLTQVIERIEQELGKRIEVADIFDYPTIAKLAEHLQKGENVCVPKKTSSAGSVEPVAIIGICCRLPGAETLDEFWDNVEKGRDCISEYGSSRKEDARRFANALKWEGYEDKFIEGGYLDEIDKFDYSFFRLTPKEASLLDPNQRLLLETAWGAMEDAGYAGKCLDKKNVGVYVGYSKVGYDYERLVSEIYNTDVSKYVISNLPSIVSGRISYFLDLKGPAVTVDTACSSSLVAVHLACKALQTGDCDMAIAGGVKTILLPLNPGIGIESSANRSRAFDDSADGTSWGEGVAAIILKPLKKALEDRDNIYAIIRGSAVNQDGTTIGITAPNSIAQTEVIKKAWEQSGINPETITYIEAHGTGTALGDPIEIEGIHRAFRNYTSKKQFCAIGAVKNNIGHLYEAAGIAGLIKAVLALKNKKIPPLINYEKPNRRINFTDSPLYISDRLLEWNMDNIPRRCGVSSFGFSGTNCHVVLEEFQDYMEEENQESTETSLLTLSARSVNSLNELVNKYIILLRTGWKALLQDICYTVNSGRSHFNYRVAFVADSREELLRRMTEFIEKPDNDEGVYYSHFIVVPVSKTQKEKGEVTCDDIAHASQTVMDKTAAFTEGEAYSRELLCEIAGLYVQGADIPWDLFYKGKKYKRVSAPKYPFDRKRCWMELPPVGSAGEAAMMRPKERVSTQEDNLQEYSKGCENHMDRQELSNSSKAGDFTGKQRVLAVLRNMISRVSDIEEEAVNIYEDFFETGFDSIILMQIKNSIKDTFGVDISVQEFFSTITNLDKLADYVCSHLPEDYIEEESGANDKGAAVTGFDKEKDSYRQEYPIFKNTEGDGEVKDIIHQHLNIMNRLISMLEDGNSKYSESTQQVKNVNPCVLEQKEEIEPFVPYKKLLLNKDKRLTESQQKYLQELIGRYCGKTRTSKSTTQNYRHVYANNRNVAGFRPLFKELTYQIIAVRSNGSRIWDMDGNEYIDLTMGFGVNLFGHNPPFIRNAIERELKNGAPLGPMSHLAGRVAELISEFTGLKRVAFYNSGTEAVMVALRLARAYSSRKKIVLFKGSYHGTFDGVLAIGGIDSLNNTSRPMAPGILHGMVEDVIVLGYDNSRSLEYIEAHAHEIAGVMVEPVQSRRPDIQPENFLQNLRKITRKYDIALVFDEVITGFRIHPGGAQAWFNIEADIATYGKVVGGGMPIGIVAGKSKYLDGIDGGMWQFGDDSYPPFDEKRTFVAGTFCHHPLAMAASLAVLEYMKEKGQVLQDELNHRTERMALELNKFFQENNVPIKVVCFGSLFRFEVKGDLDIFFYSLLDKGIYIWEGKNCFLSTAHTDEDIERIILSVIQTVRELNNSGFLNLDSPALKNKTYEDEVAVSGILQESPVKAGDIPEKMNADNSIRYRLTNSQKQIWLASNVGKEGRLASNQSIILKIEGVLDVLAVESTVNIILMRHEALRTVIDNTGECQIVKPDMKVKVEVVDFTAFNGIEQENKLEKWLLEDAEKGFDLASDQPLFRVAVINLTDSTDWLVTSFHHINTDGWSIMVFLSEFAEIYSALSKGEKWMLPEPFQFREYINWQQQQLESKEALEAVLFWEKTLSCPVKPLNFSMERDRVSKKTFIGERQSLKLDEDFTKDIGALCVEVGSSLYNILLAAFGIFLHRITGAREFMVGVPMAGQAQMGKNSLMGNCVNLLPVYIDIGADDKFLDITREISNRMRDMEKIQKYCS